MNIIYKNNIKDLPCDQLEKLFVSVGWSDAESKHDNSWFRKPFTNSTLVISAWENDCLIGVVRVLSDTFGRSVIYDLVVLPDYQHRGIGAELVRRCIEHFPKSEWMLWTSEENIKFYEKAGFKQYEGVVMSIPPFWQR